MPRRRRSVDESLAFKQRALRGLAQGKTLRRIAEEIGCAHSSVSRWRDEARERNGVAVPAPVKKAPGRPRHLTPKQEQTLRNRLKEPPWKRYPREQVGDVWTVKLAHRELNNVSPADYTEETAPKVIRRLGFRLKRRRRSPDGTIVPAHWVVHYPPKVRRKGRRPTPPWGY